MTKFTLADQVKEQRIKKGWSQELLAENAGLSLRTIQRIEKGSTIPRGDTLNKLFLTLEIEEGAHTAVSPADRNYLTHINLSSLSFLLFPFLGFIIPLLLWFINKDKICNPKAGKDLINFQITWTVILFITYFGFYQWTSYNINRTGEISISLITENYQFLYLAVGFLYLYNFVIIIFNIYHLKNSTETQYRPKINFI